MHRSQTRQTQVTQHNKPVTNVHSQIQLPISLDILSTSIYMHIKYVVKKSSDTSPNHRLTFVTIYSRGFQPFCFQGHMYSINKSGNPTLDISHARNRHFFHNYSIYVISYYHKNVFNTVY